MSSDDGPRSDELPETIDDPLAGSGRSVDAFDADRTKAAVTAALFGAEHEALRIGRFVVLEELGRGAMGKVYAAYDPELDRRLALKLIRAPGNDAAATEKRRTRLLREARAIARLSHPNVVAVYDVGTVGEEVFVAMELVRGQTLRGWLESSRTIDAIVEVFAQAGLGLAAAHEAGLVHRDFKPDNVLVGDDGRVRVVDFGLARGTDEVSTLDEGSEPLAESITDGTPLTRTGALIGTPAYMAPEQFAGEPASPRTDQYAFGTTLFESLYDQRPRRSTSVASLIEGEAVEPGATTERGQVPGVLREVLRRTLAVSPAERFDTMREVVGALRPERSGRRRWLVGGVAVLGALLAGTAGYASRVESVSCDGKAAASTVWNEDRRAELSGALAGSELGFAADTATRVTAGLDAHIESWVAEYRDACEDTRVRKERSEQTLDRRMACLDRNLRRVDALVRTLVEPDDARIEAATRAVAQLPRVEACADVEQGEREEPDPTDESRRLQIELAAAQAEQQVAAYQPGLERALAVVEGSRAIEHGGLEARGLIVAGELHLALGEHDAAREALEAGYWLAGRRQDAASSARAAIGLAAAADAKGEFPRGLDWVGHADLSVSRAGQDPELGAQTRVRRAQLLLGLGQYEEALAQAREAESALVEVRGPRHVAVSGPMDAAARALQRLGRLDESRAEYERALAIVREALGPDHPDVARRRARIGALLGQSGDYPGARDELEAAIEVYERALGNSHPRLRSPVSNLGNVYALLGEPERAIEHYRRAIAIAEASDGPDQPGLTHPLNNLGLALADVGELDESQRVQERALDLRRRHLGEKHPDVAMSLHNLGDLARRRGELEEARRLFEEALALRREALGAEHIRVAETQMFLGELLAESFSREEDAARRLLESAAAILEKSGDDPKRLERTRSALARLDG